MKMETITVPDNQEPSRQELCQIADVVEKAITSQIGEEKLRNHVVEKIADQIRRGVTTIMLTSVNNYGRFPKDLSRKFFLSVNAILEETENPWRFKKFFGRSRSPMAYTIVSADKCKRPEENQKKKLIKELIEKGPRVTINPPPRKTGDHKWNSQASSDEGRFKELMGFEVVVIPRKSELYKLCLKDRTLLGMRKDPDFSVAIIVVNGPQPGRIMIIPKRLLKSPKAPDHKDSFSALFRSPEPFRAFHKNT